MNLLRRFLLRMVFCTALLGLICACSTPMMARPLSRTEALRLADAEARRYLHSDLHQFEHSPVFYTASEGRWYIGYRRAGQRFVDFGIDVYDKTRKAWVIVR